MSALKNSPFGKRLRGFHNEAGDDDGAPRRTRPRILALNTPSLDSRPTTATTSSTATPAMTTTTMASDSTGPDSPLDSRPTNYGDRFVPTRDTGDMRTSYHLMDDSGPCTPSKRIIPSESDALKEQANAIFTSILHTEVTPPSPNRPPSPSRPPPASIPPSTPTRRRIFHYTSPSSGPPTPTRPYSMSPVRASSRQLLESPRRQPRAVCKTPYRVLDAPDLADDFYLNLVDWSTTNILGVGLGACVYLWTAHNAAVAKLCDLSNVGDTVSSVAWVQKGTILAVGTLSGRLHIYDAPSLSLIRSYNPAHSQRIGALSWNAHVLSSGSRDRMVHHRDVREAGNRPFRRCAGHKQEVCGLRWSTGSGNTAGAMLASGGNDNKVCIWDLRGARRSSARSISASEDSGDAPLWKFHEHTAAVKALAWDPHVSGVLASGGGTQDKHIRFWNTYNGTMLNQLDTGSQVCNLIWSLTSHELVSTHGFSSTTAQNQICIWRYPSLSMVAALTGHTHRVLYLAMSPEGETIVTGAGDETLRFWNAFPRKENGERKESQLDWARLIR
ncbi:WD40 repeat-like protein [Pisolithus orientalis]|uniref:WD40 repeat-like protein n=1 Tax=Pisolithus orientalis TaxID=936130 RepID=UPI0022252D2B|nr:WD40 repeat-like protein [Pisolithus orientalis]KAI6007731.1 WD40 repeat-like protein [Pisolithus orientalis]